MQQQQQEIEVIPQNEEADDYLEQSQLNLYISKNTRLIGLEETEDIKTTREMEYGPLRVDWIFDFSQDIKALRGKFFFSRKMLYQLTVGERVNIILDSHDEWERQATVLEISDDQEVEIEIEYSQFSTKIAEERAEDFNEDTPEWLIYGNKADFYMTFEPNTVTYQRQRRGLERLSELYNANPRLQLLKYLIGGYDQAGAINPFQTNLDDFDPEETYSALDEYNLRTEAQNQAIYHALNHPLTLIQGPPGTGKTSTSAHIILSWIDMEIQNDRKAKILVCAPSNIATNNLAMKLQELSEFALENARDIKIVRLLSKTLERSFIPGLDPTLDRLAHRELSNTNPRYVELLGIRNRKLTDKEQRQLSMMKYKKEREILSKADIVCVTCSSTEDYRITGQHPDLKKKDPPIKFTHALIDEATQAVEADTILPIVKCSDKVVMVGDQKQLCPVIRSNDAIRAGYQVSMFERLINEGVETIMLDQQFRMAPVISKFISKQFYNNQLRNNVWIHEREFEELKHYEYFPTEHPVMFINVESGKQKRENDSYRNQAEQDILVDLLLEFDDMGVHHDTIKVITPYRLQAAYIKDALCSRGLRDIEVASVDSFQGREADIIIISCVRTDAIGFLQDERRLNVMMSRAKYSMIILGKRNLLDKPQFPAWSNMMTYYDDRLGAVVEDATVKQMIRNNYE